MRHWWRTFRTWLTTDPARHALKTGAAVTLTWGVYRLIPEPMSSHSMWAVVTTLLVMQSNLGSLLKAAWNRWLGTAFGAALGAAVGTVFGFHPVLLGLAVAVNIYCLGKAGLQEAYRLAGATIIIVMLAGPSAGPPWWVGFERFVDVMIGIASAVVVQMTFLPAPTSGHLRSALRRQVELSARVYSALQGGSPGELVEARAALAEQSAKVRDLLADLRREPLDLRREEGLLAGLVVSAGELEDHLDGIEHAGRVVPGDGLHVLLAGPIDDLEAGTVAAFNWLLARMDGPATSPPPDLEPLSRRIEKAFDEIRATGTAPGTPTDEVLRFCTWFYNLRSVARHLTGMSRLLENGRPSLR